MSPVIQSKPIIISHDHKHVTTSVRSGIEFIDRLD
jgi:hypothetical protein